MLKGRPSGGPRGAQVVAKETVDGKTTYKTAHGSFSEEELFSSKNELLKRQMEKKK
jgi:hypothetical protein